MEDDIEAQSDIALEILLEADVLRRCPIHEDSILAGIADLEDAYKLGNHLFTNDTEKWNLRHVFESRREMTDAIKKMYEWQGGGSDECGWCMKD